jgi:hypothetical protein
VDAVAVKAAAVLSTVSVPSSEVIRAVERASRELDAGMRETMRAAAAASTGFSDQVRQALEVSTRIDAGLLQQVRTAAEAARALQGVADTSLVGVVESMRKDQARLNESFRAMSELSEAAAAAIHGAPWMKAVEDARVLMERFDPTPWASMLEAGVNMNQLAGLEEVLRAESAATARMADFALPVVAGLRELEDASLAFRNEDLALLREAVRVMPEVARPRLALEPLHDASPDGEEEPQYSAKVILEFDSAVFNSVETAEILSWARRHGPPMTCSCLQNLGHGDELQIFVVRVLFPVDHRERDDSALPSVVFQCGSCERQVFHGVWEELRRASGGLEVLEGGRSTNDPRGEPGDAKLFVVRDDE